MADQTPDARTVVAAQAGDPAAVDRLVAQSLPLVYTVVGHALGGHADTDDVVQETMLRVLRRLGTLRDPESYRSWLVAIAVRQVRDRHRARQDVDTFPDEPVDPGADFADLTVARLELSGQRRETALATRWLDEDNRELLALWWLEAAGRLTRDDVVAAVDQPRQHVAVRVQRMKAQLDTARAVVRALEARPGCPDLLLIAARWDGRPEPLWRKRFARHTRDCAHCAKAWEGLVATDRLLVGLALVAVPPGLLESAASSAALSSATVSSTASLSTVAVSSSAGVSSGTAVAGAGGAHAAAATGIFGGSALAVAGSAAGVLAVAVVAAVALRAGPPAPTPAFAAEAPAPVSAPAGPSAAPSPSATPSATPSPSASRSATAPAAPATPDAAATSAKKGVSTWEFAGVKGALADVGAGWYYNWSATNDSMPGPDGVEFVPMIWGRANVTDATLAQAKREGDVLLGFNEPDLAGQAEMSVEQALDLWPRLESTGMRLGSPAVAFGGDTPGGWLDRFMTGAEQRGLRVDFITVHWYGSDFSAAAVGHLRDYLDAVHRRYGKPIWLTEYGLINFAGSPKYPGTQQLTAFITGSTAMLEKLPYVQRYAWFGLPAVGDSAAFGLYRDADTPTAAGEAYRAGG
ncbi:sigma-70 family RNA polymerase sigma factor [Spirilliplanes yamanashiensis]|uniref:RNA polymerase sigma factor n=1 Tax=Spirilliplanes yamanashiensis TaxID=42233 RepID=A0A8J4DLE1_9ACTN|nr:sigma-70 family RNA polymerase sigma factor [Spirilliplanes yamanashiensis]MDP9818839.1 RNA polymerase sigma factor (sigma-70 family) [Spirilliplanes yamanashiensis]GIJ05293.1 hypothetical protein Sya03_46450 [Spirilliplanes yamanashiensis]